MFRYRGPYVAIHRPRVIDHDPDFDTLARRVFAKLGPVPVCMPTVTPRERIVRVPVGITLHGPREVLGIASGPRPVRSPA
ncbi:MAG: hypothetical protein C4304_00365 [candidate division GAL15 bacterium]